jgi:sarcosine oxidase/L-pipecolate oxidase
MAGILFCSQYVEITAKTEDVHNQKYTSSCREIKYGVPQGSILGPLLFLLYINDLPQYIQNAKVVLFADCASRQGFNWTPG